VARVQPTMRMARRCTALLLPRALPLGQTDGQTDGLTDTQHRVNTLTAYAVRVISNAAIRRLSVCMSVPCLTQKWCILEL